MTHSADPLPFCQKVFSCGISTSVELSAAKTLNTDIICTPPLSKVLLYMANAKKCPYTMIYIYGVPASSLWPKGRLHSGVIRPGSGEQTPVACRLYGEKTGEDPYCNHFCPLLKNVDLAKMETPIFLFGSTSLISPSSIFVAFPRLNSLASCRDRTMPPPLVRCALLATSILLAWGRSTAAANLSGYFLDEQEQGAVSNSEGT